MFDSSSVPAEPNVLIVSTNGDSMRAVAAELCEQGFAVTIGDAGCVDACDVVLIDETSRRGPWPVDPATLVQPVIVLGSGDSAEICDAFANGAADYIVPPPRMRELASRIRAALRRRAYEQLPPGANDPELVRRLRDTASSGGAREIDLTDHEERLLLALAAKPGHVVTRDELARNIWDADVDPRVIADHVRRLRAKIDQVDDFPIEITLVRGVGYRVSRA